VLGALKVAGPSLASPVPVPTAAVERVLRRLASKHRPPIAPPVLFAGPHIKMRWKSPTPTIDALRLLNALRLDLSAFVIDDDQMEAGGLKQARELAHPRAFRSAFHPGDDVERHAGTHGEFALTNVGDRARSPNVSTCREIAHDVSVADWLALRRTVSSVGTCRSCCG
jgi:hypothetical protein